MENKIVSGNRRTFRATLFGVAMLVFGGTALAATTPAVAPLKFQYTITDANGNVQTLENKITTGYEANKVTVDKNGNVYVTDAIMNTVRVFNTNGRLVKEFNVNRALAVGADGIRGLIYVSGALNGSTSIFILDNNNDNKDDGGNLGTGWGSPAGITVGAAGDVYVADSLFNIVRKVDAQGAARDYGPYGGERYPSEFIKDIYGSGKTFSRTRHRMTSPQGIAVDETGGLLYLSVKEHVEFLSTTCQSVTSGGGSDTNCSNDTGENWKYYNDVLGVPTDSTYRYWNPVDVTYYPDSVKYQVMVIDVNTGIVKSKIVTGNGNDRAHIPRGLALDGKGRLYVATTGGGAVGGQIKVYNLDAIPAAELTVSGFSSGIYTNVAFSPDINLGAPKGRLFATMGDNKTVSSYSIDNGANPANTAPTAPVLLDPVSSNTVAAVVNTSTPILRIRNAADAENDSITYAYEICSGSCTAPSSVMVTSATGITGGSNNETSMTVTQGLLENSLYHWRAQSFDGERAAWSNEATFCVDEVNSNPTRPDVIAPKGEIVSPFASSLSWTASTDPDCANTVTYEVVVSDSLGNILKTFSGVGSTSIRVADIPGLVSGNIYGWTVMAADNKGGKSDYSSGSFTYMTTSVKLDSDQAGTKVYIDGNYGYHGKLLGTVPVEKSDISPGSHFVTFIKAGYEPHYKIINITDPALNLANSSTAYTAAMVKASRVKPPATGVELFKISGGNAAPFVVDYNNDKLKDIVAGGKVYVYNVNGEIVEVIDGKVYLYLSEEQVQADGSKKVVQIAKGAIQADGVDINVISRAVPFMVDYDNDGNQDLLVGSANGGVYLYKGTATGLIAAGTLALKDGSGNDLKGVAFNLAPAVVDYNNDGKKDLVVGSSDGALRLYLNTGSDESPVFGLAAAIKADGVDLSVGTNSKAFFTDWNSDGKKDLVVGDGSGKASLFFNVGTDDAPSFVTISGLKNWIKGKKKERGNREFIPYLDYNQDLGDLTNGSGGASPFVVDWDGSSARDVIVGNGSGGVVTYITE